MTPTELDPRRPVTMVVTTSLLVLYMSLTIVGNTLVCLAVYRNRSLETVANIYILALSAGDITVSIAVCPFSVVASVLRNWPFGYIFAQFEGFIIYIWGGVSLYILLLTAINRYFCVVKPQRYPQLFTKKKATYSTLLVLVFTVVGGVVIVLVFSVVFKWHPHSLYCMATWTNHLHITFTWSLSVGIYMMFSMSLIIFCYGKVFFVVRRHNIAVVPSLHSHRNGAVTTRAEEIRTSRVLFVTVVGFCVCWLPYSVFEILRWSIHSPVSSSSFAVIPMFTYTSTLINPVIYGAMNRTMRREFVKVLLCGKNQQ